MTRIAIGSLVHDGHGKLRIFFNGAYQEVTLENDTLGKKEICLQTGIMPRSLLHALEIIEHAPMQNDAKGYREIRLYPFDKEELRAEEERIKELQATSKRRVMYVGAPTVSNLIKILENIVTQDPLVAQFPVYYGGIEWYLHIDGEDQCIIFDEEMLYEDYEQIELHF